MTQQSMHMTHFDVAAFLRDYWQKKPLLIRSPWSVWTSPLTPDELAGLACEDHVESRLVTRGGEGWELEQGPLPASSFGETRREPWTLLVQSVDHHVPEVAALLEHFRFVPNWRVDDVMVSYAVDGGGVGPHFDHYDVFLVQGQGRRRWQLGGLCDDSTPLQPHDDLRLLADFRASEEWVLEPGDILYVPPRFAHNGVAVGDDCMTYSIGFRAPSRAELVGGWSENALARLGDDDRYTDPDLAEQHNPGEISAAALSTLQAMIAERLLDADSFARWFGQFSTTPKNADIDWSPEDLAGPADVRQCLADGAPLLRNPASRFSFIRQEPAVLLFVDGHCYTCTDELAAFAEQLCAQSQLEVPQDASQATVELLVELFNRGSVAFDVED